jgi:hypothetical protein
VQSARTPHVYVRASVSERNPRDLGYHEGHDRRTVTLSERAGGRRNTGRERTARDDEVAEKERRPCDPAGTVQSGQRRGRRLWRPAPAVRASSRAALCAERAAPVHCLPSCLPSCPYLSLLAVKSFDPVVVSPSPPVSSAQTAPVKSSTTNQTHTVRCCSCAFHSLAPSTHTLLLQQQWLGCLPTIYLVLCNNVITSQPGVPDR